MYGQYINSHILKNDLKLIKKISMHIVKLVWWLPNFLSLKTTYHVIQLTMVCSVTGSAGDYLYSLDFNLYCKICWWLHVIWTNMCIHTVLVNFKTVLLMYRSITVLTQFNTVYIFQVVMGLLKTFAVEIIAVKCILMPWLNSFCYAYSCVKWWHKWQCIL